MDTSTNHDSLYTLEQAFLLWQLVEDGAVFHTPSSVLQPVLAQGKPAMLKMAKCAEERRGAAVMHWWQGEGAAKVLALHGDVVLLERACGSRSLAAMSKKGQDDTASRIICEVAARLHAHPYVKSEPNLPSLVPLEEWFSALLVAGESQGGLLQESATVAMELLAAPQDLCVLHGDLHHDNVLDAGDRGWLAIDPKGLYGERGFDFANVFCNPDFAVATREGRFEQQCTIVAAAACLELKRLWAWIAAWAGLSAVWHMSDGQHPKTALAIAERALCVLRS